MISVVLPKCNFKNDSTPQLRLFGKNGKELKESLHLNVSQIWCLINAKVKVQKKGARRGKLQSMISFNQQEICFQLDSDTCH